MRKRSKLSPEERFSIALALIQKPHAVREICESNNISHTTAYKLRNLFLDGARKAFNLAQTTLSATS